jgi:hypothetical protein
MSKVFRTVIGLLLAAIFIVGAAASTVTAEDGGCSDPNSVTIAE